MYNNSASSGSKYIPYKANLTYNNATTVTFGDTIWMYLNKTSLSNLTVNWTQVFAHPNGTTCSQIHNS